MKILLIRAQSRKVDYPWFPIALGYIASALLLDKHKVEILDIRLYDYSKEEVEEIIKKKNPDIIGINTLVTSYLYIKWLNSVIKKHHPKTPIVVGGTVCEVDELLLRKTRTDIVVIKEGEITIRELAHAIENKIEFDNIDGIAFLKKGELIRTPPRELIKDLNKIPFPAYSIIDTNKYLNNLFAEEQLHLPRKTMIMITSRGCPYHCTYCRRDDGSFRMRSPDNIIEEIRFLKDNYGVTGFTFQDECMVINRPRIIEFCNKLIEQKLNIKWSCSARVNLVDKELLQTMKSAGCQFIGFGIESGSQKMLDEMKKGVTPAIAENAIKLVESTSLKCGCTYMIGMPGETKKTIQETEEFLIRNNQKLFDIFFVTPYPGTKLFTWAVDNGKITDVEKFVEDLDRKNASEFVVNLTNMSNEELVKIKEEMIHKVNKVFLRRHPLEYINSWITSAKRVPRYIKEYGMKSMFKAIIKRIGSIF